MKKEKIANKAAFARPLGINGNDEYSISQTGMSQRFYAAVAIIQGIISDNDNLLRMSKEALISNISVEKFIATSAYKLADELLTQENNYEK